MRTGSLKGEPTGKVIDRKEVQGGNDPGSCRGKIAVVGLGPGDPKYLTIRAQEVIEEADVIVGYKTYMDLIKPLLKQQVIEESGMRKEIQRGKRAIELALSGKKVAVISSGDPGIYGMAGVILGLLEQDVEKERIEVEVVPGVSAANAAAAVVGAPLMHDNAYISLSNLLTPWSVIEKRLDLASAGDFVITLYNPKSKGRPDLINKAQEIILKHRNPETPVAVVRNARREGESFVLTTLKDFTQEEIDMFTVVIIGNSQSYIADGRLITPRGYNI